MKYQTKSELAQAFYPDVSVNSALALLRREISQTPGLREALAKTGYRKRSKRLTPRQITLICEYLGDP